MTWPLRSGYCRIRMRILPRPSQRGSRLCKQLLDCGGGHFKGQDFAMVYGSQYGVRLLLLDGFGHD